MPFAPFSVRSSDLSASNRNLLVVLCSRSAIESAHCVSNSWLHAGAKKLDRWLTMPGWLVVTCVRNGENDSLDEPMGGVAREDYAACCCAVQNLCLALHADGIGTKWTTGPVNFDPRFNEAAGVPSDEYTVGTIWFGEAAGAHPAPPTKRLSTDDVLCRHE